MPDITSVDGSAQPAPTALEQLEIPQPIESKNATKRYTFNETGNIMIVWTELDTEIPASVRALFAAVSEFFVTMLKKISTSINPVTNQPYSIYDYKAIMNVINQSDQFVHVTGEDLVHRTNSFGATFSQELIEGLLGLDIGVGSISFAQGMIASMGKAGLQMGDNSDSSDTTVANIIFICEYLLGMPIVSALVVSCDAKENMQIFKAGPCFSEISTSTALTLHKDIYMFTPQLAT